MRIASEKSALLRTAGDGITARRPRAAAFLRASPLRKASRDGEGTPLPDVDPRVQICRGAWRAGFLPGGSRRDAMTRVDDASPPQRESARRSKWQMPVQRMPPVAESGLLLAVDSAHRGIHRLRSDGSRRARSRTSSSSCASVSCEPISVSTKEQSSSSRTRRNSSTMPCAPVSRP